MFKLANYVLNVQVSEYKGHVPEIVKKMDLSAFDGMITVSGDGLFHELIDAMLNRADWDTVRLIPIGCVGAGTSRAFNKNIDAVDRVCATFTVIKVNYIKSWFQINSIRLIGTY